MLAEYGFTYDLLIYHYQLKEALTFVARVPEVNIVLDHIAKPSIRSKEKTSWELEIAALSTFENVYCKLSGMVTEADLQNWKQEDFIPFLEVALEAFGPGRLMFGSDWLVCLLAAEYEEVLGIMQQFAGKLSATEQAQIMGGNAVEFYKLN